MGAGVANFGTLGVTNSTLHGNHSEYAGGAISTVLADQGSVTISHSTLTENSAASGFGGAIFLDASSDVTLAHNILDHVSG